METHMTAVKMQSEDIAELAKALAKAQGAMANAKKDSTNPHFGSSYADLAAVWDACRKPLTDNGLSIVQTVASTDNGGTVTVVTMLLHGSGQFIRESLTLPVAQRTPQAVGSAITYARRYSLAALVGVAQEDDDGNAGSGQQGKQQPRREERPQQQRQAAAPQQAPQTRQEARPAAPKQQEAQGQGEEKKPAQEAAKPPQPAGPAPSEAAQQAAQQVAATAEASQRAARAAALWKQAKAAGMSKDGWKTWLGQVLGSAKPSSELTDDDLAALELALPEVLGEGRAA